MIRTLVEALEDGFLVEPTLTRGSRTFGPLGWTLEARWAPEHGGSTFRGESSTLGHLLATPVLDA